MKAGHICTCKSFVQQKLECNVNKVRGWVFSLLFFFFNLNDLAARWSQADLNYQPPWAGK